MHFTVTFQSTATPPEVWGPFKVSALDVDGAIANATVRGFGQCCVFKKYTPAETPPQTFYGHVWLVNLNKKINKAVSPSVNVTVAPGWRK